MSEKIYYRMVAGAKPVEPGLCGGGLDAAARGEVKKLWGELVGAARNGKGREQFKENVAIKNVKRRNSKAFEGCR